MKALALFIALLLGVLAMPLLFVDPARQPNDTPEHGLPWQIEMLPGGRTRVFGLVPGVSTFDEAYQQLAQNPKVGLILTPEDRASIEAYFESVVFGGVAGRMILTFAVDALRRNEILARARKVELLESGSRNVELGAAERQSLSGSPVLAITFIPAANLDEQIILQRFGQPAERIRSSEHTEHFLYPAKGLELRLDTKGKEVLQYVSPGEFSRLRDPLVKR